MSAIEVKVPDIGDFKRHSGHRSLVKPGDSVKPEDSLVTLESDKATMDVPLRRRRGEGSESQIGRQGQRRHRHRRPRQRRGG